jgi:hypothetical protein
MNQRFQDAIDAGLGDLRLLKNVFKADGSVTLLQQFHYIESLGKNRDQIQPLDFCLGHVLSPGALLTTKTHLSE